MTIDDRIREELERRDADIHELTLQERSLYGAMYRVFTGGWRRWAAFAMLVTLVFVGIMFWSGYEFFTAGSLDERVFWGVIVLGASSAVSMLKLWFFLEMNMERDRGWTARELKRLELSLAADLQAAPNAHRTDP